MTASLTCKRPAFGALLSVRTKALSAGILVQSSSPVSPKTATITWPRWEHEREPIRQRPDRCETARRESLIKTGMYSVPAAKDLNFEVADFLAQCIAVKPEQIGGTDLIAARGRESRRQQRIFDLPQNAMIEPGRRQAVLKS